MSAKYPKASLSVVIPAYNEEENIGWVVKDCLEKLPEYFNDFEVIVVNDGSRDKTGEICDEIASKESRMHVVHQKNGGFSRATLAGINTATKEFIAYVPADGQFLVEDLWHCFEIMEKNDLVLGYRGGRPDYTLWRMIMTHGYLLILTMLFDIRVGDVGWASIWRRDKLLSLDLKASGGVFILAEIVIKFLHKKYRVAEAPSFYHPRASGEVKNAKMGVVLKTFGNALKLWFQLKFGRS